MSSSYRSVDCIGLWSCLVSLSIVRAPLYFQSSCCYIHSKFFWLHLFLYHLVSWASVRCTLSWGRALGLLGGYSTGQLNCCLPRMEEKREKRAEPRGIGPWPGWLTIVLQRCYTVSLVVRHGEIFSEMTYNMWSATLNPTIPYHTMFTLGFIAVFLPLSNHDCLENKREDLSELYCAVLPTTVVRRGRQTRVEALTDNHWCRFISCFY